MKMLKRTFKVDPERSRSITAVDIFLACIVAFGLFPAVFFILGYGLSIIAPDESSVASLGGYLAAIGFSGLFAWMAIPVFAVIGWFASRIGWIGGGSALILGLFGGLIFGTAFWLIDGGSTSILFVLIFPLPAAIYALVGWAALRYLRPDIFKPEN